MRAYSVEIFSPSFELKLNTNVNSVSYKEDYLSPDENKISVVNAEGIVPCDYIRISRAGEEYVGVVKEVAYGGKNSEKTTEICFMPLIELLNIDIVFDTKRQNEGAFEDYIAELIRDALIENTDELQNIKGLGLLKETTTQGWNLHITPSEKGGRFCICNLLDSVVIPAMEKYSIFIRPDFNVQEKAIVLHIGVNCDKPVCIESDLPNVLRKNLVIKQREIDVNKLVIYDASTDYEESVTYYLHSNLGYDRYNRDRLTPVKCMCKAVVPEEGKSFDSECIDTAYNTFAHLSYTNLIELTFMKGDLLVEPEKYRFGQVVDIVSNGTIYRSILTGREVGETHKLIFGTVRLDLTKILRRNST